MSSSGIRMFNYTPQSIAKNSQKITDIIKRISVNAQFQDKKGSDINVVCKDGVKRRFNVFVEPLLLRPTGNQAAKMGSETDPKAMQKEKKGCIVRMENLGRVDEKEKLIQSGELQTSSCIPNKDENNDEATNVDIQYHKSAQERFKGMSVRDALNVIYNMPESGGGLLEDDQFNNILDHSSGQGNQEAKQIDYAEGVYCKRLIDGKFYDVNLLDIDEEKKEDVFDPKNSVFKKQYEEMVDKQTEASSKRLDKLVRRAISNVREMISIRMFKIVSFLWILSIAVMSSFQLIYSNDFFNNTDNLIDIMLEANKQLAYFARVNSGILDIEYLAQ